jgi:hypothetical protein
MTQKTYKETVRRGQNRTVMAKLVMDEHTEISTNHYLCFMGFTRIFKILVLLSYVWFCIECVDILLWNISFISH